MSLTTNPITIGVAKNAIDSILDITVNKSTLQVKLKNSIMCAYPTGEHRGGKFFATDSISFTSSAGLRNVCSYRGKKK